ncbi:hypothetical protein [Microbispora sp. H10830]|uniref:hypothetical protein n=1 Tax=Microbispora sp. H10830 TaxID=2729109 RepID=UPI0015FEBA39|nr:hypothetical protein [Microbispora sp. H10830]
MKRVAQYGSFEELLDTKGLEKVNPASPATSSSPTAAASSGRRRTPSACWPSRSSW